MLEFGRFFYLMKNWCEEEIWKAMTVPIRTKGVFLLGQKQTGKTSLLFHYASSCALEGRDVLYISSKRVQNKTLLLPKVSPPISALQKIKVKYIEDYISLRNYLANAHLFTEFPELIIVDDFHLLFQTHERTDFAKIFALLQSTTEFIKQKSGKECLLIVSETSESNDLPKSRILLSDRWLPLVISLDGTKKPLITMTISKYNLQPITDFFQATFLIDPLESTFELQTLTIPDSNSSQADKIMN